VNLPVGEVNDAVVSIGRKPNDMVRETRYLWVANLPEKVNEDQIAEYFGRQGGSICFFCSPRLVALDIPTFAGSTTTHTLDYPYLEYHKAEMCRPQSLDIIRWRIWINTQIMLGLFGDMVDLHSGVLLVASYFLNFFFSSKYPRVSIVYQDACSLPIQYSWTVTYIIKMQKKTITLTLHRLNATFDAEIML